MSNCLLCLKTFDDSRSSVESCDLPIFIKFIKFVENYLEVSSVATKRLLRVVDEDVDSFCGKCELTIVKPLCGAYSQLLCAQARLAVKLERLQVVLDDSTETSSTSLADIDNLDNLKPFRSSLAAKCRLRSLTVQPLIATSKTIECSGKQEDDDDDDDHLDNAFESNSDWDDEDAFKLLDFGNDADPLHLETFEEIGADGEESLIKIELPSGTKQEEDDSTFHPDSPSDTKPQSKRSRNLEQADQQGFRRPTCSKVFSSPFKLRRHNRSTHESRPHRCSVCSKNYKTESGLSYHVNTVHKPTSVTCPHCQIVFCHEKVLKRHVKLKHSDPEKVKLPPSKQLPCPTCGKVFSTSDKVSAHIRVVHGKERFSCTECNVVVKTKKQLNTHIQAVHNPETHICHLCGKTFGTVKYVKEHVAPYHATPEQKESWLKCPKCEKRFYQMYFLKRHLRSCESRKGKRKQNSAQVD